MTTLGSAGGGGGRERERKKKKTPQTSELYYARIEILGIFLFLQSVLANLYANTYKTTVTTLTTIIRNSDDDNDNYIDGYDNESEIGDRSMMSERKRDRENNDDDDDSNDKSTSKAEIIAEKGTLKSITFITDNGNRNISYEDTDNVANIATAKVNSALFHLLIRILHNFIFKSGTDLNFFFFF